MIFLSEDKDLSTIEKKADEILKGHNGVYLDNRLYSALRKDFPELSRKDFRKVVDNLLETGYSIERGLIRPLTENEIKVQMKEHDEGKNSGKGSSDRPRLSTKRGI
ncbi:MAG: hypothetical protein NKF70_11025 [Methanobacterium sp. ERen5]|nr:MAG: hypothetical protein NKF70_11025 [Methanobacterium sp. ERen5]